MIEIGKQVTQFLKTNTVWMYLTMLMFVSYVLVLDAKANSWLDYLANFLRLTLIFSPVLLFVALRPKVAPSIAKGAQYGLWLLCFIGYPIGLYYWLSYDWDQVYHFFGENLSVTEMDDLLLSIASAILFTELAIQANNHLLRQLKQVKWLQRFGLERSILTLLALLALFVGGAATVESMEQSSLTGFSFFAWQLVRFIFLAGQCYLIGLVYYGFYYCNHYILIPKLLKPKGVIYYVFSVAAVILVCYPLLLMTLRGLPITGELRLDSFVQYDQLFGVDGGSLPLAIMVLSVPIIISNQWFRQHSKIADLAREKSETELHLLKQQINPHFFFNTLNNLYALSLTQAREAPEVILQLSELMRYVIYRGKEKQVTLAEEVKYIQDYVKLQQIRTQKDLAVQFDVTVADDRVAIPPLLFIILVENAFKHGVEPAEGACWLQIALQSSPEELVFTCTNSIIGETNPATGIGLDNLRRRLALLFPEQHRLETTAEDDHFRAVLTIQHTNWQPT